METSGLQRLERTLFLVVGVLMVALMLLSALTRNHQESQRQAGSYTRITELTFESLEQAQAPTGVVNEVRFTLGEIESGETLVLYLNHHNIEVYLEEEQVATLTASDGPIRTTGGVWLRVPLREADSGKEVRLRLYPLYPDYQDRMPYVFLGSELAIYQSVFYRAIPELLLSLCVILAGVFLLLIGLYHSIRRSTVPRLYAVGLLAVSAGVWRVSYGKCLYVLLPDDSVLIYTLSVLSLMLTALAMLYCAEPLDPRKSDVRIRWCSVAYCLLYAGQIILQLAGVFDLRQMLKLTHFTIVVSAVAIAWGGISTWFRPNLEPDGRERRSYSWILGIGVVLDLLLYYFAETSVGMLFTLSTILLYSLLEGVQILIRYTDQKHALEEMNVQLTLSRTATMMSQIRSHFVFNILNAISGMCKYDPAKADDTVVRFARYLRNNIDIMEEDKNIPFSTDLRQLEDYVLLEQVRFEDKLDFYTDIETDQFLIPPLILQPVVENAIKHGISKKPSNGTIILRTRDRGDAIVITVEDDGVGFEPSELAKEGSVGLKNIRFRLYHLAGGTLEIQSEVGKGTTVTILLPKKGDIG